MTPLDLAFGEKSPEEVAAYRLAICEGCEFFRKRSRTCMKCGCFMSLKTTLAKAECPVKKW